MPNVFRLLSFIVISSACYQAEVLAQNVPATPAPPAMQGMDGAAPAVPAVAPPAEAAAPAPANQAAPAQAAAAPPDVKATKFEDWYLRCVTPAGADAKAAQCEVAQISQVKDNGKDVQILTMAFAKAPVPAAPAGQKPAQSPGVMMTTVVPLNMYLPAGLILLDGKKELKKLNYRNCNEAGCWTQTAVDDKFLKELAAGKDVIARMQLMTGQNVNLKFSVNGLSAALGEMRK